jgi:comEA protein
MRKWQYLVIGFLLALILSGAVYVAVKSLLRSEIVIIAPAIFTQAPVFEKININTASVAELEELPGIGREKAEAIVAFRENNGTFRSIEDLLYVPGIGSAIFEKIKDQITV